MCRGTVPSIMGVIAKYQSHQVFPQKTLQPFPKVKFTDGSAKQLQPLLVRFLFVLGNLTCTFPSRNHENLAEFVSEIIALFEVYAKEALKAEERSGLSDDHLQILVKVI